MSVLKNKRKASQFEVFHHLYKMRREITDLLLRDFGYSFEKADKRLARMFGGRNYSELTEAEQERYGVSCRCSIRLPIQGGSSRRSTLNG